jgi:hypothetical protein
MIRTKVETLALVILSVFASTAAYGQTPVIRSAIINSTTITIGGSNLLPTSGSPVVYLDGVVLTLVSSSSTHIVAELPTTGLPVGSLRLTVGTAVFDVTNGAVGPAGPIGPQGPAGTVTLPFNGSADGGTNAVFNIVNTSSAHSAMGGHGAQPSSGGNGGNGVGGYGGASNGGTGGSGMYALGGVGSFSTDGGGSGINAQGGNSAGAGGKGVMATGGSGEFGGDGIDAYGGTGKDGADGVGLFAVGTKSVDAAYFNGDVGLSGTIVSSSGALKIDHPLDPANRYLYHSSVE